MGGGGDHSDKSAGGFWCERQQKMDFFTGGRVIMD